MDWVNVDRVSGGENLPEQTEIHEVMQAQLEDDNPKLAKHLSKLTGEELHAVEDSLLNTKGWMFDVFANVVDVEAQDQLLERLRLLKGYQTMNPSTYRNLVEEINILISGNIIEESAAA